MLTIDRFVLRLPDEHAGRAASLGRAIEAALATWRPSRAQGHTVLAASLRDVSPAMSDAAIAAAVVRTVAARLDQPGGRGRNGQAP
jgi:hypothetical protein